MDCPIVDFVFNLIVLLAMISLLILIWAIIISMIVVFLKNRRLKNDTEA